MEKGPNIRRVLWDNVSALMRHRWGGENLTRLASEAEVGVGSVIRLKACDTDQRINTIESIAKVFELTAWQLLVPGLEPSNPPVLAAASSAERKLYKRFLAFKKAMENGDDEDDFQDTRPGPH